MLSSVTNEAFSRQCQPILREASTKKAYTNRYWVTLPQSRRSCNAVVLPYEAPTRIHLQVEKVVALTSLPKGVQTRILDEFPPFFGTGVGIFSDRKKWRAVTAERLLRVLNRNDDDRALYIDIRMADSLEVKYSPKSVIDIRNASSVFVFNAEQLDDPYKGEPQKGVALNAITGKRLGQPAHDILLGVGILRGYISPMWIAERQMKFLNLKLKRNASHAAVLAPNMTGAIVSLSTVPLACQRELLRELKRNHPDAFGVDLFFLYNVNGWEVTRSRVLVKHMMAVNDEKYPFHFVNLSDLRLQKPQYSDFVQRFLASKRPIGPSVMERDEGAKAVQELTEGRLSLQTQRCRRMNTNGKVNLVYFFAEDATLRRYYNAECMTQPHLTVPSVRSIAFLNGKLIGRRDESILRMFALKHKLSSPIWLTESAARRLGVHILRKHKKKYVTIGAMATDDSLEEMNADGFYNIDDFPNPEEILTLFPKSSKRAHFMLDSKWRPVLGKKRQDFLTGLKRTVPLWVSVNECLMSGFEPKAGTAITTFHRGTRDRDAGGTKLYNSQFTSDPVRVIGLATAYTRPQGTSL